MDFQNRDEGEKQVTELARLGRASVRQVTLGGKICIEKKPLSETELLFYQHYADRLNARGIFSPAIMALDADEKRIVMELIPHSVKLAELQTPAVFQHLAGIHAMEVEEPSLPFYRACWTERATASALDALALPRTTIDFFHVVQAQSAAIFAGNRLITGDSNPGNWGRRANGELVQFDWERLTMGCPSIDLAPLINGMGTPAQYEAYAGQYLACRHRLTDLPTIAPETLVSHIAMAKAWIVIEVVNILLRSRHRDSAMYLDWYRQQLPSWCDEVAGLL
ncbi:phosphotransferase [Photobacterium atrarenae]|uniref:Aminoglycoside phosphotransferase family protein n=1 Tax=Photobacterium atrarenae TaxID=865757 RepID=A0ABY5GM02_9GAMM|nr:phosphotransferase [Photobacterium atrarenae]UTV30287.1 aminoglycoside phosphotransferase family protein [Photobacterium atrarenae]